MSPPFYYVHREKRNCEFLVNFSLYTNAALTMHNSDFVIYSKEKLNGFFQPQLAKKKSEKLGTVFT